MLTSVEKASRKIESLAGTVEDAVAGGRGQVRDVIDRVKGTIDNVNGTLSSINRIAVQIDNSKIPRRSRKGLVDYPPSLMKPAHPRKTQRILRALKSLAKVSKELVASLSEL